MPVSSMIWAPTTVLVSWKAGRQCMNLTFGLPLASSRRAIDLEGREEPHPLDPHVLGLAHRDPHVGVDEVGAGHGLGRIVGDGDGGAGPHGDVVGDLHDVARRLQVRRPAEAHVGTHEGPHDQQRAAHVEPAVADEGVGELVVGLVRRLVHGQEVGQHLGGVPLVGEAVVDGDAGVAGQLLDILLGVAAELDGVVHAAEHPGRVGDRLLVTQLRAGRVQVGDVRPLVVRRDLERGPRPRRGLLEDERDLLAVEVAGLGPRVLGRLQRLRRAGAGSAARTARSRSP